MKLKAFILGSAIAAAAVMPSFAFDVGKDFAEWTKDPDVTVTAYLGMPYTELEENFKGTQGWESKTNSSGGQAFNATYTRIEPLEVNKKVMRLEKLSTAFIRNQNGIHCYAITLSAQFGSTFKDGYAVSDKKRDKKAAKVARDEAARAFQSTYDNICDKLGQPTRPEVNGPNIGFVWYKSDGSYYLFCSLKDSNSEAPGYSSVYYTHEVPMGD